MSEMHRVQDWKKWMSPFQAQTNFFIRKMENDILAARNLIEKWDSLIARLNGLNQEINMLYTQLSSCQASLASNAADQVMISVEIARIQMAIAKKVAEKGRVQAELDSTRGSLRHWQSIFGNNSYYNDLGIKLNASTAVRNEMEKYKKVVQQAQNIIDDAAGPGGRLKNNKYVSAISDNITATRTQLADITSMQHELFSLERNIVSCCQTAISVKGQINDRIGESDPQQEYGQKTL